MNSVKKHLPLIILALLMLVVIGLLIWISNGVLRQIDETILKSGLRLGYVPFVGLISYFTYS